MPWQGEENTKLDQKLYLSLFPIVTRMRTQTHDTSRFTMRVYSLFTLDADMSYNAATHPAAVATVERAGVLDRAEEP